GNIQSLMRYDGTGTLIDNFAYTYQSPLNNKLDYVHDQAGTTTGTDLQPGQTAGNYSYDVSGNLIADEQGSLTAIKWNAMGKVDVIEDDDNEQYITFYYDGTGNRVQKDVLKQDPGNVNNLLMNSDIY